MAKYQNMLDPKMFTSCFAPVLVPNCGTMSSTEHIHTMKDKKPRRSRKPPRNNKDAMRRIEGEVRMHVAAAVSRRCESLITKDDDSATLLTEVDLRPSAGSSETEPSSGSSGSSEAYSSSSETRDLNTIGDDHNFQQAKLMISRMKTPLSCNNVVNTTISASVVSPTSSAGAAKNSKFVSFRSKFDHMRLQKQFSNSGQDPPCDKSMHSFKSLKAGDAMKFMTRDFQQKRRNGELAKQIMNRRQYIQSVSRTGFDP